MTKLEAINDLIDIARQEEGPDGSDWERLRELMAALGLTESEIHAVFVSQGWA